MSENTDQTFQDLGLSENLLKAIDDLGYKHPTPIQATTIPITLMTRDIVGIAQTGTGKTGAFTLPMIEMLAGGRVRARMPRSLVLTPTRELAMQVSENFEQYGKYCNLSHAVLVGGISMEPQIQKLDRGVDVLIATPGRLLDLFNRGNIMLADIKILVIDEADRMLDMGFIPDLEKIINLLSPMRQTLLFSATMSPPIRKLAQKFLSNPKEISVAAPSSPTKTVDHFIIALSENDKKSALSHILFEEEITNAFIFCNRKRDIDGLKDTLERQGIAGVAALHGDMDQHTRTKVLDGFKNGDTNILVCSDVAGRGLDVQDVSHVFNYNVPQHAEDYVHRIGRTGRAGKSGRAFTFATPADGKYLQNIEKLIGDAIPKHTIEGFDVVNIKYIESKDGNKKPPAKNKSAKNNKNQSQSKAPQKVAKLDNSKNNNNSSTTSTKGFGDDVPDFFRIK